MRILQITKYYYPALSFGGPIQCTYNIAKSLVERGHEVTVYATDALQTNSNAAIKNRFCSMNGAEIFFFRNIAKPYRFFISPGILSALRNKSRKFDIVHLHEYRTFQNLAFHLLKSKHSNISPPYVLSAHGEVLPTYEVRQGKRDLVFIRNLFDYTFGRRLLQDAEKLIATTQAEKNQYIQYGIDSNKATIIPNGIEPADFIDIPPPNYFRKSFGIGEEQIILYLGRINDRKGLDVLIRAFSILVREKRGLKLVIAGPDDGYLTKLEDLVNRLMLGGKVLFTNFLSHKQKMAAFKEATLFIYPGFDEIFGIASIEAAFFEKPVIAAKESGIAELVRDGEFGLLVEYGNVTRLKEAILTLLNDERKAQRMGQNGKKYVLQKLTWSRIVDELENLYLSLV